MANRVGYLIPEWPGQTHVWVWREVCHLREQGLDLKLLGTRRPQPHLRGRHAFTAAAEADTTYLWPVGKVALLKIVAAAALRSPIGFARCIALALALPTRERSRLRRWRDNLALILPACNLAREVRRLGITRLHTDFPAKSAVLCMMVRRLIRTPFSLTIVAQMKSWGGAMQEKFDEADFVAVTSNWMLGELQKAFPSVPRSKIIITSHGVDTSVWTPGDRRDASNTNGAIRLLSIGRLHRIKAHDVVMRSIALLMKDGVDVQLRIIGEGEDRPVLEKLITELGLADRVTLVGSRSEDECLAEVRATDVFVLASHEEPLGVVYMEAMSTGVATVGTSAGGVPEVINDRVDGLLVPPGDPVVLAAALRRLIDDPALRTRLAAAGRESAVSRLDSRNGARVLFEHLSKPLS